jgi:crossover junction endodeoxyribonuclease RusA
VTISPKTRSGGARPAAATSAPRPGAETVPTSVPPAGVGTPQSPVPAAGAKPPAGTGTTGRTWTLELREGTPIITANNRLDRWTKNALTQALKAQVKELARKELPKIARADIAVEYFSPPRLKRMRHPLATECISDSDNVSPTAKALIDGIVKAGIFPSDSKKYVRQVTYILAPETHPRGLLRIHISEVAE